MKPLLVALAASSLALLLLPSVADAAFASVGSFCTQQTKTSATSFAVVTTAELTAAQVGILVVAANNITTTDGNSSDHTTVSDTVGNTWTKAREYTNGQASASGGATVSIWSTVASSTLASGATITVAFAGSIAAKAVTCWRFSVGAGSTIQRASTVSDLANDGADAGSLTLSGLTSGEFLYIRGGAVEGSGTTYTVSTNFTTFTHTSSTTSGGTSHTNMGARGEFRIATGTGDTTDPTTSTVDQASTMVAFSEVASASRISGYLGGGYGAAGVYVQ